MDTISLTAGASLITVLAFIYQYMKDRYKQGHDMGKLEQRVSTLESDKQLLETLSVTLTETRMAVTRLEQKVDHILERDG
jgi:hypothetical protein